MQATLSKLLFVFIIFFAANSVCAQKYNSHWYRSVALCENDNIPEALKYLDSAIAQSPKNVDYRLKMGDLHLQLGNLDNSLEAFNGCEELKPGSATLGLSKVYALQKKEEMAIAELGRYLAGNNKVSEAHIKLDPSFEQLARTGAWNDLWKKEWYNANERMLAEVEYNFTRKEWNEAIDALSLRLAKSKGNHRLLALRGEAFFHLGDYKMAESDFSQAIERSKRNAKYYQWRGRARFILKQFRAAVNDLSMALDLSGGDPKVLPDLAHTQLALGNYAKAIENGKKYLDFYPSDNAMLMFYARASFEVNNHLDALFALGRVVRSGKANADCFELRGIIYTKSSSWELALADFTKALELDPSRAQTMHLRAEVLLKQGQAKQACAELREAIEKGHFPSQELFYKHCKR